MKIIFMVAVLFIIGVGIFGLVNDRFTSNERQAKVLAGSEEKREQAEVTEQKEQATQEESEKQVTEQTVDQSTNQTKEQVIESTSQQAKSQIADSAVGETSQKGNSEKEQYISRLDSIKTYYDDLWSKSDSLDMTGMKELQNQEYTKWDDELNTIYQLIKKKLPDEKFTTLRDEEREWIKVRDKNAEAAASEFSGGTMEGLQYMRSMTDQTMERTYKLVEIYFEE
jgi:uncharacterized protein YecT (DUF1311 family)